jgi:GMP synthase (glutamine-hydrolysing)
MALSFALLNASHEKEPAKQNIQRELDGDITEFDVRAGDLPETVAFDAAIITGSPASVLDDKSWIDAIEAWVEKAIDGELPILGICFGQQVLADVLGGEVADMETFEIGYHMIKHTPDSHLFDGIDEWFTAFTAHSDEVAELPPGAEPIATNNFSVHGFRNNHVFAVQFHPAFDMETAEMVLEYKDVDKKQIDHVLDEITQENYVTARETTQIFDNFSEYVRENRSTPSRDILTE